MGDALVLMNPIKPPPIPIITNNVKVTQENNYSELKKE